jgi:hypothetical protein
MRTILIAVLLASTGCMYRITDTETGRNYYAKWQSIRQLGFGGGVDFVDEKTKDEVMLPKYQIHQLTDEESKQANEELGR